MIARHNDDLDNFRDSLLGKCLSTFEISNRRWSPGRCFIDLQTKSKQYPLSNLQQDKGF